MPPVPRVGAIAAILIAGAVAYFAYAAGEAGPMVTFGRGDANIAAEDAWLQLPLHLAVALGFAVAGPIGVRSIAWSASWLATAALGLWAAYLLMLDLGSFGDYADVPDVVVSGILLVLYGAAWALSSGNAPAWPPMPPAPPGSTLIGH
jgi:hypothetical protein